jgi:DNA-binding FadR family transcriptional regulator
LLQLRQRNSLNKDLFEVRRGLEPLAAEKAALLMTPEESAGLLALVDSISPDASVEQVVANDLEFHHRIARASGNTVLCSFIDGVSNRTQRARIWRGVTQEGSFDQTQREHRGIARAIADRQPSIAAALSLAHVAGIENWIRHNLAEEQQ